MVRVGFQEGKPTFELPCGHMLAHYGSWIRNKLYGKFVTRIDKHIPGVRFMATVGEKGVMAEIRLRKGDSTEDEIFNFLKEIVDWNKVNSLNFDTQYYFADRDFSPSCGQQVAQAISRVVNFESILCLAFHSKTEPFHYLVKDFTNCLQFSDYTGGEFATLEMPSLMYVYGRFDPAHFTPEKFPNLKVINLFGKYRTIADYDPDMLKQLLWLSVTGDISGLVAPELISLEYHYEDQNLMVIPVENAPNLLSISLWNPSVEQMDAMIGEHHLYYFKTWNIGDKVFSPSSSLELKLTNIPMIDVNLRLTHVYANNMHSTIAVNAHISKEVAEAILQNEKLTELNQLVLNSENEDRDLIKLVKAHPSLKRFSFFYYAHYI